MSDEEFTDYSTDEEESEQIAIQLAKQQAGRADRLEKARQAKLEKSRVQDAPIPQPKSKWWFDNAEYKKDDYPVANWVSEEADTSRGVREPTASKLDRFHYGTEEWKRTNHTK